MWCFWSLLLWVSLALGNETPNELKASIIKLIPSIYEKIAKVNSGKNFIYSPFSAESVLFLLEAGARGETATELQTNLHLPTVDEELKTLLKDIFSNSKSDEYTFQSANKLYLRPDFVVNEGFKTIATDSFEAETENINFVQNEDAAITINQWVEQQTNSKIKNLVEASKLTNRTRAVLVNGLYFKADWKNRFYLDLTRKRNFYKSETEVVQVDTLHTEEEKILNFHECPDLNTQWLELPFKDRDASLVIALPNERTGLAKLENKLNQVFEYHNLTRDIVEIALPKFKIETEVDFKNVLQALGVTKIFDGEQTDLTGISGKKGDLVIDDIIQKSFINVNEVGVEAAAATAEIVSIPTSGLLNPPRQFIADHPFIWYIKVKGIILFVGRVISPDA